MEEDSDLKKSRILIVQQDKEDEKILSDIISFDYDVIFASTEEQVLELLQEANSNICGAIFDAEKALEIVKSIRIIPSLEEFPILVSVSDDDKEREDELIELNIVDFIKKPFSVRRVLNRLRTVVKLSNANKVIFELERDELTGLYTRQAFLRRAQRARQEKPNKKYCVMAFDFDNFKSSNTLYGEEKCNEFLSYSAKKLKAVLARGIAGRYGGDQFILFFDYDGDRIEVERIQAITKSILDSAPIPHQVVKIGVNAPINNNLPLVVCCDRAFLAIREIKGLYGKNIAFFEADLQKQLLDEQRIIETMEQSLKNKEFQVYYQPKHETITGRIVGAEALVRWQHPEYGFMSPGQFIPLFEKNGFITRLDVFVLEQVCKDIKRWQKLKYPIVPISVNVSRRDFIESGNIDRQIQIIDSYKIDHSLLHMEVTESLYSDKTELIVKQVKKVQNLGFMIEMDDFGAGYSSLGLLSSFPLNILKLDITFVRNLEVNEVVVENIIKMAHRMGLLTVAEGAETNEQFRILKTLGCDFIQGYYFSKPLSVSDFEDYLNRVEHHTENKNPLGWREDGDDWHMNEKMLIAVNEVAEGIPGGFFSYHADGELEIISFNRELMNMFACKTAEEFREYTGNSFKGIVISDEFDYVQKSIETQIKNDKDLDYVEYRIKAKDGTIKYVKDYGRFVKTKKYGDVFYVFLIDITAEEQFHADVENQKMKSLELELTASAAVTANRAKNVFVANTVRDILPVVKSIVDYTDVIEKEISDGKTNKENFKELKRKEEHLLGFVNNLDELAKIESGSLELQEKPTDISNAVEKIYALAENAAAKKGVKLEYWSMIYNPYIYQDIVHTTDVVMNIIYNAIKYTPAGGRVRFGLKQTPCDNPDECLIDFICEDTGIGISKKFLPYICRDFAREDNEVNAQITGAGLGLSIAKSLLNLMHGTIEITSKKGKGTVVTTSQPHRFAPKEEVSQDVTLTGNVRV